jgi:hypothetical protein
MSSGDKIAIFAAHPPTDMMKTVRFISVVSFFLLLKAIPASAQEFIVSPGVSVSNMMLWNQTMEKGDGSTKVSFAATVRYKQGLGQKLSVQSGLGVLNHGTKLITVNTVHINGVLNTSIITTEKYSLTSLNIPVMLGYEVTPEDSRFSLSVLGGTDASYALTGSYNRKVGLTETGFDLFESPVQFKRGDISAVGGLSVKSGARGFELLYRRGLTDIATPDSRFAKARSFGVTVGFFLIMGSK